MVFTTLHWRTQIFSDSTTILAGFVRTYWGKGGILRTHAVHTVLPDGRMSNMSQETNDFLIVRDAAHTITLSPVNCTPIKTQSKNCFRTEDTVNVNTILCTYVLKFKQWLYFLKLPSQWRLTKMSLLQGFLFSRVICSKHTQHTCAHTNLLSCQFENTVIVMFHEAGGRLSFSEKLTT